MTKGWKVTQCSWSAVGSKSNENNINANFNLDNIVSNPRLRKLIEGFDNVIRDQVRREYLTRNPCQQIMTNKRGVFKMFDLNNIHDWSIVWQNMRCVVFGVIFLSQVEEAE